MSEKEKVSLKDIKEQAFRGSSEALRSDFQARPVQNDGLLDYVLPVASVPLPSRGKVYPPESPVFDTTSLDVRAMNASDENIMTSETLIRRGKMLSTLIGACVVNRNVDPDEMLAGDRNALMIAIRNASYGPRYPAEVECRECGCRYEHEFDLSRLPILPLEVDPVTAGTNAFEFTLPVTKKKVIFRLSTGNLLAELNRNLEAQAKTRGPAAVEENVTQELFHQIISIDGVEDRARIARFVQSMPVVDSRELRAYVRDINPDVDMRQAVECPKCGEKGEVEIPMGQEFFWPKARSGKRRRG